MCPARNRYIFIPTGAHHLVPSIIALIENHSSKIPLAIRPRLLDVCDEIRSLENTVRDIERELEILAKNDHVVTHLRTIPGIGLLSATGLVAFVGNIHRFPSGRHFSSYLGLTPREHSSGLKRILGSISKQGDPYLRMLLIHGARSILWASKKLKQPDHLRAWALRIEKERGRNKAAVALANKLARIAWAVWKSGIPFQPGKEVP
jgi:transposase